MTTDADRPTSPGRLAGWRAIGNTIPRRGFAVLLAMLYTLIAQKLGVDHDVQLATLGLIGGFVAADTVRPSTMVRS